jgi:hypothetical protein
MFVKLLVLCIFFLAMAAIGLGIRMLLKTHGRFPETHVERNQALTSKGITCARQTDIGCHPSEGFSGCSTCSERIL